jgi:Tfp pilus assembly protein PilN
MKIQDFLTLLLFLLLVISGFVLGRYAFPKQNENRIFLEKQQSCNDKGGM